MSVSLAAGTDKFEPFGIPFYRSPVADETTAINEKNYKKIGKKLRPRALTKPANFADKEAKRLSFIPGPKYGKMPDWRENVNTQQDFKLMKKRKTFTDDVMEYEKQKPAGPSDY